MISQNIERAQLLMDQERFDLAKRELTEALRSEPDNPYLYALFGVCQMNSGEEKEGLKSAQKAVALDPEFPFAHQVVGWAYMQLGKHKLAETSAREAIKLDTEDPGHFELLSSALAHQGQWKKSLDAADEGLALDAENQVLHRLRAQALSFMGRGSEAHAAASKSLRIEPESPYGLAHAGWVHLRQGHHKEALEFFRQSLKLEPGNEHAREGLVEALRARYLVYRIFFKFFVWLSRFPTGVRWAIIITFILGRRVLESVGRENSALAPIVFPIAVILGLILWFSVIGQTLFNITLLTHPLGKYALTRDEKLEASFGASFLVVACVSLLANFAFPGAYVAAILCVIGLVLVSYSSFIHSIPKLRPILVWTVSTIFLIGSLATLGTAITR